MSNPLLKTGLSLTICSQPAVSQPNYIIIWKKTPMMGSFGGENGRGTKKMELFKTFTCTGDIYNTNVGYASIQSRHSILTLSRKPSSAVVITEAHH